MELIFKYISCELMNYRLVRDGSGPYSGKCLILRTGIFGRMLEFRVCWAKRVGKKNFIVEDKTVEAEQMRFSNHYRALCPFHQENTPSMVIDSGDHKYHCLSCGKMGQAKEA